MRREVLEIVESLEFWEMQEVIVELSVKMSAEIGRLKAFYRGVDQQVFGIINNVERAGLTDVGLKQVEYLKTLVDNFKA